MNNHKPNKSTGTNVTSQPLSREHMNVQAQVSSDAASTFSTRSIRSLRMMLEPLRLRGGCGIEGACNCCEDPIDIDRKRQTPIPPSPHWRPRLGTASFELDTRSFASSPGPAASRSHPTEDLVRAKTNQTDRSVNIGLRQALKDDPNFGTAAATGGSGLGSRGDSVA